MEKLLGEWRSFVVDNDPADPEELTFPDGLFNIEEIDDTGKISKADHDGDKVNGQVISLGPSLSIVMEHNVGGSSQTNRYIGYLVVDEPDRMVIIGKKGSYDETKATGTSGGGAATSAADAGQDDGTVIITKP